MENLIDRINAKGNKIRQNKIDESDKKKKDFLSKLDKVKELAPRISKMWDVAQALISNGFRLGDVKHWAGFKHYTLESDSMYHWLGFVIDGSVVNGFGIVGGGCCGKSLVCGRDGEFNLDMSRSEYYNGRGSLPVWEYPDYVGKLNEIVYGFDDYERKFYEYAERIAA